VQQDLDLISRCVVWRPCLCLFWGVVVLVELSLGFPFGVKNIFCATMCDYLLVAHSRT